MRLEIPDPCLMLLVGVAGCGKSTFAARHFAASEVVSSDACRELVSGDPHDQRATPDAFDLLSFLLGKRLKRRRLTVIDATNLVPRARRRYLGVARKYDIPVVAVVLDLPFPVCRERDQARTRPVGAQVLAKQQRRLERARERLAGEPGYQAVHRLRSPQEVDSVEMVRIPTRPSPAGQRPASEPVRPPAVVVDLDGTLASTRWREHHLAGDHRDWAAFFGGMGNDAPVQPLVALTGWLGDHTDVVVVTGRPADYEPTIRRWLGDHDVVYTRLLMRRRGDYRSDVEVKRDLYQRHVAPNWDVQLVIDDREQVVDMWRQQNLYVLRATDPGLAPLGEQAE